jgi:hypothetical protein
MPVHWATMVDDRHAWVARVEHLTAMEAQYSKANAKVYQEYIADVLAHARAMADAFSSATPPAARMMMIDAYNVAWLESLTLRIRPRN